VWRTRAAGARSGPNGLLKRQEVMSCWARGSGGAAAGGGSATDGGPAGDFGSPDTEKEEQRQQQQERQREVMVGCVPKSRASAGRSPEARPVGCARGPCTGAADFFRQSASGERAGPDFHSVLTGRTGSGRWNGTSGDSGWKRGRGAAAGGAGSERAHAIITSLWPLCMEQQCLGVAFPFHFQLLGFPLERR